MSQVADSKAFTWIHLSNWHIGQWRSDVYRQLFAEDIKILHEESGPIHALILAGGVTGKGLPQEFERLNENLVWFLGELQALGSKPTLVAVPGTQNVDHNELWASDRVPIAEAEFRDAILHFGLGKAFKPYLQWADRYAFGKSNKLAAVPGDFALTVAGTNCRVGLVGLNSTWVRPSSDDRPAALHSWQLKAVCQPDLDTWTRKHDFCLLVSYYSPAWLGQIWRSSYRAEIAPPGRFALHLCGLPDDASGNMPRQTTPLVVPAMSRDTGVNPMEYVLGTICLESGLDTLTLRPRRFQIKERRYIPSPEFDPTVPEAYRHELSRAVRVTKTALSRQRVAKIDPVCLVERLEIFDIRGLAQLTVAFDSESKLPGRWTCLAGINGAGKSSILQSLCLALLGEPLIQQLGGERLERLRRLHTNERRVSQIGLWLREGRERHYLEVKLRGHGMYSSDSEEAASRTMRKYWQKLWTRVIVSYGATRNLSDYQDPRHFSLSADVRRQITLFDPLAQIASAETLLGTRPKDKVLHHLFSALVKRIFGDSFQVVVEHGKVRFLAEKERIEALDLPDGFRSLVAWMADLCAAWCEKFPERARKGRPQDIDALVLIDEIDLHLHPSLQRILVPRLRETLPRVQWVVSTHSPLILSCFDSAEIVALDRSEPGGIRFLDRQILGFSTDEIYQLLLDDSGRAHDAAQRRRTRIIQIEYRPKRM